MTPFLEWIDSSWTVRAFWVLSGILAFSYPRWKPPIVAAWSKLRSAPTPAIAEKEKCVSLLEKLDLEILRFLLRLEKQRRRMTNSDVHGKFIDTLTRVLDDRLVYLATTHEVFIRGQL